MIRKRYSVWWWYACLNEWFKYDSYWTFSGAMKVAATKLKELANVDKWKVVGSDHDDIDYDLFIFERTRVPRRGTNEQRT